MIIARISHLRYVDLVSLLNVTKSHLGLGLRPHDHHQGTEALFHDVSRDEAPFSDLELPLAAAKRALLQDSNEEMLLGVGSHSDLSLPVTAKSYSIKTFPQTLEDDIDFLDGDTGGKD